jgi:SAM-dependent methyltransferase
MSVTAGQEASAMYADGLRRQFPQLEPVVDDLFLLESHQIAALPQRAPRADLAVVLRASPQLVRFLVTRHPPIEPFLEELLHAAESKEDDLAASADRLLWEIADYIVYQREPAMYDTRVDYRWGIEALSEAGPLAGRTVVDAGAGTGYVTFVVAAESGCVYAVEPVATLRRFIRDKASTLGISTVYAVDGFLNALPLPAGSVDVLITQRAIGWDLEAELDEIERVVRPGGTAIHLAGMPLAADPSSPLHQGLLDRGYNEGSYQDGGSEHRKYFKHV